MALNPYALMHVVLSHLKVQGKLERAQIGEPKSPPLGVLTAAILMDGIRTPTSVLDAPVLVYDLTVRLYRNFLDDGTQTELEVARSVGEIMEAFHADFTLGGNARAVDFMGIYGRGMDVTWGHLDFGNVVFRTADISVPIIVDPAAVFAA